MLRSDVAAFGKEEIEQDADNTPFVDQLRNAESAVRRAEGALVFADPAERAVQELRRLYEAVAPIILAQEMAS